MNDEYLVFFETSGNQSYVFATNKLRENIGASELTYRAGTEWVLEAAGFTKVSTGNPAAFREWLKKGPLNDNVEVVLATSGKSLLVVSGEETARNIVEQVTTRALKEAPGLSITGAIVKLEGRDKKSVADIYKKAHDKFNANRDLMATPAQRFAMLPFCESCVTTGLPASERELGKEGGQEEPLSSPAFSKRNNRNGWFNRIRTIFKNNNGDLFIASSADSLEKEFDGLVWLGIVFADGNGLGQIMMNFHDYLDDEDYLTALRNFSIELDTATENAFYEACKVLEQIGASKKLDGNKKRLPLVPLLLGGDDLTVLVDGDFALPFTKAFLEAFEKETQNQPTLSRIAEKALGVRRLSAGAGVAIVKAHFPFHSAHVLAESLLKSAKLAKKHVKHERDGKKEALSCSAFDFHILFDAAFSSLDDIRNERRSSTVEDKVHRLWGGPYVITDLNNLADATEEGKRWAETHALGKLLDRVDLFNAKDENDRLKLPNSQMHDLRETLPKGKAGSDERLAEMRWLDDRGLNDLLESENSLFHEEDEFHATRFLDALTSIEFWGNKSGAKQKMPSDEIEEKGT